MFFLAILVGALVIVGNRQESFPHSVPIFDVILMAFAALRVTRLVVYDKITRWFRELFTERRIVTDGGKEWVEISSSGLGIRSTIHDLLQCPWCIGFWSSLIIALCYFTFSWAWFVILFLAIAGAGSLLQLLANLVGWRAENLKQDALEKESRNKLYIDISSLGK